MAMAKVDTQVRLELLDATDETIEDAVQYADPMALRGLLYQMTGDEEVAATRVGVVRDGFREAMGVAGEADVAMLRRKAAEFLKEYRDTGAGEISIGSEDRLPRSLRLA